MVNVRCVTSQHIEILICGRLLINRQSTHWQLVLFFFQRRNLLPSLQATDRQPIQEQCITRLAITGAHMLQFSSFWNGTFPSSILSQYQPGRGRHTNEIFQWRHNGRDGVSNHQPYDCLLNRLFRHRWNKTSKLRVTGLCEGNSPVTGEFPAQMASNAENVSIWWRHHYQCVFLPPENGHLLNMASGCLGPLSLTWINFNPNMDK